ncbi:MAG: phage tail sheath subtilisin-like domain-containing protein [Candidatus Thiodiazotropha sp. (ex Lucinoma borealis)]|nr:phage tail sheath subtilisin-like domain-containing protein [Candidatus Thiodiazotropha sp. (ex Lucinoma borealis)]
MALSGLAIGAPWRPGVPPGVYEDLNRQRTLRDVRMDVAAFIGLTERGPVSTPVPIDSWRDYLTVFGDPGEGRLLADSVHLFFANGGRRCVVVRALSYAETSIPGGAATARWHFEGLAQRDGTPIEISARNPGFWGNRLEVEAEFRSHPLLLQLPSAAELTAIEPSLQDRVALSLPHPQLLPGALVRVLATEAGLLVDDYLFVSELRNTSDEFNLLVFDTAIDSKYHIPDGGGGQLLEAMVVNLNLHISLPQSDGNGIQEHWRELGLHPMHPRYLSQVTGRHAASENLLVEEDFNPLLPDANQFEFTQADQQLAAVDVRRTGSELIRLPWSNWTSEFLPAVDTLAGETRRRSGPALSESGLIDNGSDGEQLTQREHFFSAPGDTLGVGVYVADRLGPGRYPHGGQPAPIAALAEYDDRNETQPVSLLHMPDLAHPLQFDQFPSPAESLPPVGTRFGNCVPTPIDTVNRTRVYPHLALSDAEDFQEVRNWQRELVEYCEQRGDRIVLLDLPPGLQAGEIINWRRALVSKRAALFTPYLLMRSVVGEDANPRIVPPGGAVCGLVARRDAQLGLHVSPANLTLEGVAALHNNPQLPDAGFLHAERINAVRPTPSGLSLLGSRTTALDSDWTHIPVRRLIDYLERQLTLDIRWAVFEPNNPALWNRLIDAVEARLRPLYDRGAFKGATPAAAYFIRCDAELNTTQVLDQGQVILLVGVAPAVPAEFIIFRLTQHNDGAVSLEEAGG